MAQVDTPTWYPGHCYLETALFARESTGKSFQLKILDHTIHKRNLPDDAESEKKEFSYTKLHTNIDRIPDGSLQLIRFVGLAHNAPVLAETHQDRQVLAHVFSTLSFPLTHAASALSSPRVEQGRLFAGDDTDIESKNPAFYVSGSRFCAIWRFDSDTKSTRMVIVNYIPTTLHLVTGFVLSLAAGINHFKQCFGHPMFMSLVLIHFVRLDAVFLYDQDAEVLSAIESQVTLESANRISTMQQLRDLGRLVCHDKFVLSALRSTVEQARIFNERTYADKTGNFKDLIAKQFLAHLELQRDLLELDVTFLENTQENIAHQQTAISTIVNMQDGASMKTIAVITMAFLPGTFLASVFAMPVFPQGRDDAFWLYWAISLPLTTVVFLAWLAWFYWHTVSRYYEDPRDDPLVRIKAWWKDFTDPKASRAQKKHLHNLTRRRLAGDSYKEWIDSFHESRMAEKQQKQQQWGGSSQESSAAASQIKSKTKTKTKNDTQSV